MQTENGKWKQWERKRINKYLNLFFHNARASERKLPENLGFHDLDLRLRFMEPAGEEEQDGVSVHSPAQAPPSSASSLPKACSWFPSRLICWLDSVKQSNLLYFCGQNQDHSQVELELRALEALETYPPVRLKGNGDLFPHALWIDNVWWNASQRISENVGSNWTSWCCLCPRINYFSCLYFTVRLTMASSRFQLLNF